jgi:ELWxxDGT repeat protein
MGISTGKPIAVFRATDGTPGNELWVSDGTNAGTYLLKTIDPSTPQPPEDLTVLGGQVLFEAFDSTHGHELWITDGTSSGTQILKDINPGTPWGSPGGIAVFGSKALFSATDGVHGRELWITDGTTGGTQMLVDINSGIGSSYAGNFTTLGSEALFSATDGVHGFELWVTDGTSVGTHSIKAVRPQPAPIPAYVIPRSHYLGVAIGGKRVFGGAYNDGSKFGLWVTDGSSSGTYLMTPQVGFGSPPVQLGAKFLFDSHKIGSSQAGLWVTDGTTAGTYELAHIAPLVVNSGNLGLQYDTTIIGNKAVFSGYDATHGYELWVTNGTAPGTYLLKDIQPGAVSSKPRDIISVPPAVSGTPD